MTKMLCAVNVDAVQNTPFSKGYLIPFNFLRKSNCLFDSNTL